MRSGLFALPVTVTEAFARMSLRSTTLSAFLSASVSGGKERSGRGDVQLGLHGAGGGGGWQEGLPD